MKKVLKIFIIILLILICSSYTIYAMNVEQLNGNSDRDVTPIEDAGNGIIKVCSTIGSIVSVFVLICLGIKYMLGSVEEKAEYKKTLMPYTIGAIFVFAASTIASVIYNILK